ncbi:hypothetical protein ABLE92_19240 [Gordonia sp. VNQ95]|uniref:hypothetical protein n=1 Tax=Gordonia TaxID=2053 RepID=UPI0032B362EB
MTHNSTHRRFNTGQVGIAMLAAGVLFALYPLVRGFDSEEGRDGAEAFAIPSWMAAHPCAMAGFVLIADSSPAQARP